MDVRKVQVPQPSTGRLLDTDQAGRVGRTGARAAGPAAQSAAGDSIAISPEARDAILVDRLVGGVLALPEARPAAVAAARAALDRGELDSPAAIQATVDAIAGVD